MRGRIEWLAAGYLIVLLVLVASCSTGPSTPAATAAPGTSSNAKSNSAGAAMTPLPATAEKPQYGGVLNVTMTSSPTSFDQGLGNPTFQVPTNWLTNEELVAGDWSRGPAGTGEFTFLYPSDLSFADKAGALAESWKIAEPGHMVFKIRQGVHFSLDPNNADSRLVNGREMTADDIAYSLNRMLQKSRFIRASAPNMVAHTTITAPDKYSLDIKYPPEETRNVYSLLVLNGSTVPKELVDKYGDLEHWTRNVGPGAFMLTDYVSGSSLTFARNPNYWRKDPVGPGKGNQLPYLDGVKILILPDASTRLTAMRTGKIDFLGHDLTVPLPKEDYDSLMSTTPQLKSLRFLADGAPLVDMRTDKQDLPFKDVRVREALTMAIDYKSIVSKLMGGDGEYPGFPTMSAPDFKSVYFPLSAAPQVVQDMYTYNPTKAKQLLAEAGYPDGFKTNIVVNSAGSNPDQVAVFKDYWSKIGVDLTLKPTDAATWFRDLMSRNYDQMFYGGGGSYAIYSGMTSWVGKAGMNASYINDPTAAKAQTDMLNAFAKGDNATVDSIYKSFEQYAMTQAWYIPYPRPYDYVVWWPWLKNYHGEKVLSYTGYYTWAKYVWLDQGLKKSMLGQ